MTYCSKCGMPVDGGMLCAGAMKLQVKPVLTLADMQRVASQFVLSRRVQFADNVTDDEISTAITKIAHALWDIERGRWLSKVNG